MKVDYSSFLHALQDGSIWWRLDDAIKLGAGYLPVRDDERNLIPVLRAKNNRVRANERTLLSEFSQDHYTEAHPRLSVRDDGRYVEAHEFLKWLSQHITLTQSDIPFPDELIRAVRCAVSPPVVRALGDYSPRRKRLDSEQGALFVTQNTPVRYIAYPRAMKLLANRLDATPEELAAWVFMGNLEAFLNANELDPPPKFSYCIYYGDGGDFDYLAPLMACWFREDDIANFEPDDRYITGTKLIERWSKQPGIRPIPFVCAKIAESRLMDMHPITGLTQGSNPKNSNCPPIESALFVLTHVEEIEAEDFGEIAARVVTPSTPCQPVAAWHIIHRFPVIKGEDANEKWWKKMMQDAKRNHLADCRVGAGKTGPRGSLWRPDLIAGWLVDRDAKGRDGLSSPAAGSALKKFPGCEEVAEEQFPPEESNQLP